MIATVKAHLEQEGRIAEEVSVSNSDTDSDSASPRVDIFAAAYESRSTVKEMMTAITAPQSSGVVINEAKAEASNVNKGKGIMTKEDEERLLREKREKEERRRGDGSPEKGSRKKSSHAPERTTNPALQEQLNREEEEKEKKKKEDAKFRITDSELAKEMREEGIEALISQGEDADYLEKHSNKEIYRAFMGQQGQLAKKKKAEEEEKARQKSKKAIAFNRRTHEERKVMPDFLKAMGEIKKEEEERLGKKVFKTRVIEKEDKRPIKKQKTSAPDTTSTIQKPSTNIPKPSSPPPKKSKQSHPAPSHQQPPIKKSKPTSKPEDSQEIVICFYSSQDQWFEVFRGRTEARRLIYTTVDEVMQLPDSYLRRILELGEAHEPANEGGKHLMLVIKHHFNPSKDVIIDVKPLQSHSPFVSWSHNADMDEFTLTDVKKQQMRCSSKTIFKMPSKDIKTLSELPLNNPSKDPRGYEVVRIVCHMQKLQQQRD
ncbi:hypothetical protein L1987_87126 [Smallanthus sonchifolius]|nr:hypothetical protein L1987_87126 [Smallanthus sonchifolius]